MTLAIRVLAGLGAGFLLGLALAASGSPAAAATAAVLAPVGTIFINLIRMTVIPLVMSILISNIGSMTATAGLGRAGIRALVVAIGLLAVATIGSAMIAQPILAHLSIAPGGVPTPMQPGAAAAGTPSFASWFVALVPQNVFKAAVDGDMLPLIIFAVLFGLALARVPSAGRDALLRVVDAVVDAMQRLVGWILQLAPIGVFALAVPLAMRFGIGAAGALAAYVVLVVAMTVAAVLLLLYPLGIAAGPLSMSGFVAYCAPAQAVGFASRSSLAALPVMMESAERQGLRRGTSRVLLPLSLTVFHFGAAVAQTVGVIFLARLFGVTLTISQFASVVVAVVLASFAVPGIPGGSIIAMVPVLGAANIPIDGIGILLAVDTIPDMFRTTANITGALTLSAVVRSPEE